MELPELPGNQTEGKVAKAIETETAKMPSDVFLWTGIGMLASSFMMFAMGRRHAALMVGQLAYPILIMGVYDKIVKQSGHDYQDTKPTGKTTMPKKEKVTSY